MSAGVIKSLKCNCTRESGYCRRQERISRGDAEGRGWETTAHASGPAAQGGRKQVGAALEANNNQVQRIARGLSGEVLAVDKPHHLLFPAPPSPRGHPP